MPDEDKDRSPWSGETAEAFEKYSLAAPQFQLLFLISDYKTANLTASISIRVKRLPTGVLNACNVMLEIKKCAKTTSSKLLTETTSPPSLRTQLWKAGPGNLHKKPKADSFSL